MIGVRPALQTTREVGAIPRPGAAPSRGPAAASRTRPAARTGEGLFSLRFFLQVAACAVPPMAAVAMVRPTLATYWLFGSLAAFMLLNLMEGRLLSNLALLVGVLPALMLLRGFFFYNAVLGLLALGVVCVLLRSVRSAEVLRRARVHALVFFGLLYWLLSFMLTDQYHINLRVLELVAAAAAVVLLAERPAFLARALLGASVSLVAMGLAMLSFGPRLGMVRVPGMAIGNPITFGIPIALLVLLLTADRGRLLMLRGRPRLRMALTACLGLLLLLSTSRGSWLIVCGGLFLILLLNERNRRVVLGAAAVLLVCGLVLFQTERREDLTSAFDRTFSGERSLKNRTSGRSEQWALFLDMADEMPLWGVGPGKGMEAYARYSRLNPDTEFQVGREFQWHSLYMHVGVEAGLVGYLLLLWLFGSMFRSNLRRWRRTGDVSPLLGTSGFVLVGISVIGFDAASGLHLGVGLLSWTRDGAGRGGPPEPGPEERGGV